MTHSDARDLLSDLIYLRKGAGFTASRMADAGTLRSVLGGDEQPYEDIRDRFVSAIGSLSDADRDVLMAAYALTSETEKLPTLRQRREHHGKRIGRKVDTVASREDAALEVLRTQLLSGWYPASPLPMKLPEAHGGIVMESVSIQVVVKDRHFHEARERYRFLAAFDEADYVRISADWPGIPITLPEGRSEFTVKTQIINQSRSHDFYHDPPMRRGQSYDLMYKVVPDPDDPDFDHDNSQLLTETSRAFHERTLMANFEVLFIGDKPQKIWSFERLSVYERPGLPRASTTLEPRTGSSVRATFRDLYGGLFSGIAWEW